MFVLLLLLAYANLGEGYLWSTMSTYYQKEDVNATWIILNLTTEIIHDTDVRISKVEVLRQGSWRSAPFEIGYIGYQIQDEYRKMLDIYNTSYSLARYLYPMEHLLHLHDIEFHYWSIQHLCNMQHEIERKYRIFSNPDDEYVEPEITSPPTFVMPDFGKKPAPKRPIDNLPRKEDILTTKKRKGPKKSKEQKYLDQLYDRVHSTKKKSTRWWWPVEYGWEIETYW